MTQERTNVGVNSDQTDTIEQMYRRVNKLYENIQLPTAYLILSFNTLEEVKPLCLYDITLQQSAKQAYTITWLHRT